MSQQFTFRAPRRTRPLSKPSDDQQAPAAQPSPAATLPAAALSAHTPAFVPAGPPPPQPPAAAAVPAVPLMTAAAFLGVATGERPVPERVQEFMWKLGAPWEAVLYELLELWRGELAERRAGGGGGGGGAVERLPSLYAHDPRYLQHGKQIVLAYLHEGFFNYLSHVVDAAGGGGTAAAPTPVPPPNAMQLSKREFTQRLHQFKRWAHSNTVPSSAATVRRLKEEPAFLLAAHKAEHARVAEAKTAALAHRRAMQAERKESPEERVRRALAKEERRKAREEARRVERQSRLRQKSAKLAQAMANPMYWRMQVMNQIALEQAGNPAYWRHQFHADEARRRMEDEGADPTHWRQVWTLRVTTQSTHTHTHLLRPSNRQLLRAKKKVTTATTRRTSRCPTGTTTTAATTTTGSTAPTTTTTTMRHPRSRR